MFEAHKLLQYIFETMKPLFHKASFITSFQFNDLFFCMSNDNCAAKASQSTFEVAGLEHKVIIFQFI